MWALQSACGDALSCAGVTLWTAMALEGSQGNGATGRPPSRRRERRGRALTVALIARTRIHGLRYVYSRNSSFQHRALWLLAFCTSLGCLLSWSSNRFLYLLSFPTHTKFHMEWAKELAFPAVTICNNNPVRFSKMTKSDLYFAGHWLGLLLANRTARPIVLELLYDERQQWFERLSDFRLFLPPRNFEGTSLEFLDRLGHQLDDMLLSCKYRGEACGPHNFSSVFTRYGKCYVFNSGQDGQALHTTVKGGTGNGLEIMLDIQQDEYLPVWGETEDTTFEAGVRVQIHSQAEPPFVHELGFGVAPGFQTFVSTQEQRLTYLPPPWGDCQLATSDSDFFSVYSITACRIDCETRYLVENCNCRMVHMPGNADFCTPEQYKECAEPTLVMLAEKDGNYCVCRTPCNLTRYNKELSMVKIPSKTSARYLEKKFNKSEKYITDNILVLDVFFEALNYETIEQKKAYEVAGLLGDIGGQMGLFVGASILTILELFDYMYEVLKERLLDFLNKEEEEANRDENVGPCDPLPNHSETISHTVSVPLQTTLGTLEEIAC
ncbi:acid-sensing ion channel 2 isoform X1 [Erpetoichthys calabaricus]|uniref:Acid-sensing (proton-gated) ion channel 2 n=1 Tax=Erpetoichthys calabaricus TaxID=27687 RepID=A0A8C4TLD8_ERPCA|nr:acid-sensing ion channel 2 isoform X1 [Erpetoichthys calabaricus]